MSPRAASGVVLALAGTLVVVTPAIDWPALSGGRFWSDGATYTLMAESLARDHDLRYEKRDLERILPSFPEGPEGVFLKRAHGGVRLDAAAGFPWLRRVPSQAPEIYYAKAYAHPVLVAPFVWLFGVRGLLAANGAALAAACCLGYAALRRRCLAALPALLWTLALLFGTVVPLYLVWPQPELLGLALTLAALAAWLFEKPAWSAVLFGIASYAKPTNLLLALPLGVAPLLAADRPLAARLRASLGRGVLVALVAAGCFGATALVTGEANYQGGERKTFYGHYPFEGSSNATFGNSGFWMTTEHLGPRVAGLAAAGSRGTLAVAASEVRGALLRNLGYFWVGRYAGALPYYLPAGVALLLFALRGRRETSGWLALASLVSSALVFVWLIPDNWYGGGGTLGNRYFLNLLPLAFLIVPVSDAVPAAAALALGVLFVAPMLRAPFESALLPGRHAVVEPFRSLPLELTMLNDLGFNHEPWRKKQPFGDPDGDPRRGRAADPRAYWLYFPDDGSYGREVAGGIEGFWLRGGATAEIVVRALEPVTRLSARLIAGPAGDRVSLETAGGRASVMLAADASGELAVEPGPGFLYYDSLLYVVRLRSQAGMAPRRPGAGDTRVLGSFVHLDLEVAPRASSAAQPQRD